MVLPAKIFETKLEMDLGKIFQTLKSLREEESYEKSNGKTVSLVTEILDLKQSQDSVKGIFAKDFIQKSFFRRQMVEDPATEEAPFCFLRSKGRNFLIVLAPSGASGNKKLITNYVANRLCEALFGKIGDIVELEITTETLQEMHESNPEATNLIWFDQVDIPGINKLCLAGSSLADTQLYQDYLSHGKIWYVVFEVRKRGIVVGIARNAVVTLFSKSSIDEFINYISEDLLELTV